MSGGVALSIASVLVQEVSRLTATEVLMRQRRFEQELDTYLLGFGVQLLASRGGFIDDLLDSTACTLDEWNAKVDALLAECGLEE